MNKELKRIKNKIALEKTKEPTDYYRNSIKDLEILIKIIESDKNEIK